MTTAGNAKNSSENSTTASVPTDSSATGALAVIKAILPDINDIDFSTIDYQIDNHLDENYVPVAAPTTTLRFMTKDKKGVTVIVEG